MTADGISITPNFNTKELAIVVHSHYGIVARFVIPADEARRFGINLKDIAERVLSTPNEAGESH